ncbi:uncharacterized protein PHACADRAFT_260008 [Phanerochaete carnosa HHB-10118-sp]|uniref:Uncharacterized protein n=1 Tax=Phanerochaete carnosa (strain HHB-10118-sp) TaxID=650164 RepID=K5UUA6_PHACS|nr:uncharacterized protein PHACADRAFT_260008 [Phanerochaete carnosa HHB-10118-sp]EKM53581.1 hypothetical protein PHACADRAFT_260008 [Phanerochaete carnosa HHB-10118-sp]
MSKVQATLCCWCCGRCAAVYQDLCSALATVAFYCLGPLWEPMPASLSAAAIVGPIVAMRGKAGIYMSYSYWMPGR